MELRTVPDTHNTRVVSKTGSELFSITPSTGRGDESLVIRTELPGLHRNTRVPLPDGMSKYSQEARALAMKTCVEMMLRFGTEVLGIDDFSVTYDTGIVTGA